MDDGINTDINYIKYLKEKHKQIKMYLTNCEKNDF